MLFNFDDVRVGESVLVVGTVKAGGKERFVAIKLFREIENCEMTKKRIYLASPHMSDEGFEEQCVKEAFELVC